MSMPAPVAPVLSLPDPRVWVAGLVTVVGEARRGIRPWKRMYPLLDLPVVAQLWPDRKVRHPPSWHVAKVIGQQHTPTVWEFVVLIREDLRYRAVAVRLEAGAHSPNGHAGPPGRRLTPLSRLHPDYGRRDGSPPHSPSAEQHTSFRALDLLVQGVRHFTGRKSLVRSYLLPRSARLEHTTLVRRHRRRPTRASHASS